MKKGKLITFFGLRVKPFKTKLTKEIKLLEEAEDLKVLSEYGKGMKDGLIFAKYILSYEEKRQEKMLQKQSGNAQVIIKVYGDAQSEVDKEFLKAGRFYEK